MNHIFKKIWNKSLGCMVVVSENAKSAGKTDNTVGTTLNVTSEQLNQENLKNTSVITPKFILNILSFGLLVSMGTTVWAQAIIECRVAATGATPSVGAIGASNSVLPEDHKGALICYSGNALTGLTQQQVLDAINTPMSVVVNTDEINIGTTKLETTSQGLDVNNAKITGLQNGTDASDAVNLGQVRTLLSTAGVSVSDNYAIDGSSVLGSAMGSAHQTENNGTTLIKVAGITVTATGLNIDDITSFTAKDMMGQDHVITDPNEITAFKNAVKKGGNLAVGTNSSAVGIGNIASDFLSNAIGLQNTASGVFSNAIGSINTASGLGSNTIGYANIGTSVGSTAIGLGNQSTGIFSNAVGGSVVNIPKMNVQLDANNNKKISIDGIDVITVNAIIGTNPHQIAQDLTAADIDSINGQSLSLDEKQLFVDLLNNTNPPQFNTASGMLANALGLGNAALGTQSSAMGVQNTASGYMSSAVGVNNQATEKNSSVFGSNSIASHEGATALGNDSETDRINSISVGKVGAEKQITNVAAGNKGSTDAVNVQQLEAAIAAIPAGGTVASDNYAQGSTNAAIGAGNGFQHELTRDANSKILAVNGIAVQTTGTGTSIADITGFEVLIDYGWGAPMPSMETDAAKVTAFKNAVQKGGNISVGENSSAIGIRNIATTTASAANAMGYQNIAKGTESNAIGNRNIASGTYSNAMGSGSVAIGQSSTALGNAVSPMGGGFFYAQNDANGYVNRINGISVQSTATSDYDLENNPSKMTQFNGENVTAEQAADIIQALKRGANLTTASNSTAIGTNNIAAKYNSNAIGYGNTATGKASSAMGLANKAQGWQSSAVGANNTAQADYSNAMGYENTAQSILSNAVGAGNTALGQNSNAVGVNNQAQGVLSNAIGSGGYLSSGSFQRDPTAPTDLKRFLLGGSVVTTSADVTAFTDLTANMILTVDGKTLSTEEQQYFYGLFGVMNSKNTASGIASNAFGMGNAASGTQSSAVGVQNTASGYMSNAVGFNNQATAKNSSAFGSNSKATHAGATALGNESETDRINSISVGKVGAEKQITNVAAGNKNSTDAVNVQQLEAAIAAIPVGGGSADSVLYDTNSNKAKITLAGGTTGTKITNLQDATLDSTSTDAVTGKQLNATNDLVATKTSQTAFDALDDQVNDTVTGLATKASQADLTAGLATKTDKTAFDTLNNQVNDTTTGLATKASQVDLTAGLASKIGYDAVNTDVITLRGVNGTTISNLKAGVADTDAVNVKQLKDSKTKYFGVNSGDASIGSNINGEMATGHDSLAVGVKSKASNTASSALGAGNTASGISSNAIGSNNQATGLLSNAIGSGRQLNANNSQLDPTNTKKITIDGVVITTVNDLTQSGSVADTAKALTWADIAAIDGKTATYQEKTIFIDLLNNSQKANTASGMAASAVGVSNTASGIFSNAVGSRNTASGYYSSALGFNNTALGQYSSALGYSNIASGMSSSALGYSNIASGEYSSAVGYVNRAYTFGDVAIGQSNIVKSSSNPFASATGLGIQNYAYSSNASAIGTHNSSLGKNSVAVGSGTSSTNSIGGDQGLYLGQYTPRLTMSGTNIATIDGVKVTTTATDWTDLTNNPSKLTAVNGVTLDLEKATAFVRSVAFGGNVALNTNSNVFGIQSMSVAPNATAIGYNSLADEADTISVGRSGAEKRITNVANATKGTDAVNLNTLNLALQSSTGTGISKNYAHDVSDTALGGFSGTAHRVRKDSAGKITAVSGIAVTTTGAGTSIDDITGFTVGSTMINDPTRVANFKEAAKNGGNIAVGLSSSAVGVQNTASGKTSSAVGYANIATQTQSSAMGALNYVSGEGSSAIGSASTVVDKDGNLRKVANTPAAAALIPNAIGLLFENNNGKLLQIDGIAVETTATTFADVYNNPDLLTAIDGNTNLSSAEKEAFIKGLTQGSNVVIGHASSAMGSQNTILGKQGSAVGFGNTVLDESNSALGLRNFAQGKTSNAIGSNNQTSDVSWDANAIGASNNVSGWLSNAIGSKNTASAQSSSAIGVRNIAREDSSVALGFKNQALGVESSALGTNNTAIGQGASAIGANTHQVNEILWDWGARIPTTTSASGTVDSIDGIAVTSMATNWDDLKANPSKLTAINGIALDAQDQASIINSLKTGGNIALGKASNAVGSQNIAAADNSSVFGVGSIATAKNSTAIGYNAVANEENTISVGKVGAEQRITNVADAVNATDAANKNYVDTALSTFTGNPDTVLYDAGSNKAILTLAGGTAGTKITNLQDATLDATSTDAVTGKQLNATNDLVAAKASQTDLTTGLATKTDKT
ncbi:ESPR-type extended signal peptide-containing protein, partial [Acinetobacter sp. CFCC 10889]|uniref:ESPR-type extended signal peptide-containing protein n=1 Tax=Acinetobacter sp. CFCC 10889 TaxID=1775557 RepID=UPI0013A6D1CE